jgi:hypothetical protein
MFLSLVFHNHQPVGQLPWAYSDVWREAYQPFLKVLDKHPTVRVGLHYTGSLLDWLLTHKPETIEQIQKLVARGQVEILAGGYYEPILRYGRAKIRSLKFHVCVTALRKFSALRHADCGWRSASGNRHWRKFCLNAPLITPLSIAAFFKPRAWMHHRHSASITRRTRPCAFSLSTSRCAITCRGESRSGSSTT